MNESQRRTPKFGPKPGLKSEHRPVAPEACEAWAALLPDAAEDLLSRPEREALDRHVLTCEGCAWELADAQRGAAWLALLKGHVPEPPESLLSAILEKTSLAGDGPVVSAHPALVNLSAPAGIPAIDHQPARLASRGSGHDLGFGHDSGIRGRLERWLGLSEGFGSLLQPRLAMTTSTAFFSICLTLNLLGVSIRNVGADPFNSGGLQRTVADTGASLIRSFEGNRVVYRVESRVNEWRTANSSISELPLGPHPSN